MSNSLLAHREKSWQNSRKAGKERSEIKPRLVRRQQWEQAQALRRGTARGLPGRSPGRWKGHGAHAVVKQQDGLARGESGFF